MTRKIEVFTEMLQEALAAPLEGYNDFVNIAICAEELRRLIVMEDNGTVDEQQRLILQYEANIKGYTGPWPEDIADHMRSALRGLRDFVGLPLLEQSSEEGMDCLVRIDEVLMIGAACVRSGKMSRMFLYQLLHRAETAAEAHASSLVSLWDKADDRWGSMGHDCDFDGLYDWALPICELSETRIAIDRALRCPKPLE